MTMCADQNRLRRLTAEALGTALLLAVVVGSGIMGERVSGDNVALALLGNTVATGAALVVLISIFGPISGAHFNPVVTLAMMFQGRVGPVMALAYGAVQCIGAVVGVVVAHLMFDEGVVQISLKLRDGPSQIFSEAVATFGLLITIFGTLRFRPEATAAMVGLYISAAYWFTASTSFANPAVTIARAFSDTFSGIGPGSVPGFLIGQGLGLLAASFVVGWLFTDKKAS